MLAYDPSRGKDGLVKKTVLADSANPEVDDEPYEADRPVVSQDPGSREGMSTEDVPVSNEVPDVLWNDQQSAWISHWIDQVQDVEEIAVCEVFDTGSSLSVLHNKTALMPLSSPIMLIDSGASASSAGRLWILKWLKLAGVDSLPPHDSQLESFPFWKSAHLPFGRIASPQWSREGSQFRQPRNCSLLTFAIDIANTNLPFLLSRHALASMKSRVDFRTNELLLLELVKIPLSVNPGGHISRIWNPLPSSSVVTEPSRQNEDAHVFSAEDSKHTKHPPGAFLLCISLDSPSLLKTRKQLGHASAATISWVCKRDGKSDETSPQVFRDCEDGRAESNPQAPRINRYQSMAIGETVFLVAISPNSPMAG